MLLIRQRLGENTLTTFVYRQKPAQGRHDHVILYSFNTESPSSSFSQTLCVRVSSIKEPEKTLA